MRVAGLKASPVRVMLAAQLDTLNMLLWMQTKDAAKGRNRPAQILPNFLVSEETEEKEISVENLDEVAGGGAFSNIPRVPTKKIDDKLRENI